MKKLIIISLFCLTGCLTTSSHNPIKADKTNNPWWRTPYYADTPKDKNPWLKFVVPQKKNKWHDPWKQEDLKEYGVDILTKPKIKEIY